ncbi:hypothetical protein F5Y03DRAFT_84326 [Xylaria venustula]|nr:hypothetical protein F5Y03DRAFT_84326 [Xylaria venustula]
MYRLGRILDSIVLGCLMCFCLFETLPASYSLILSCLSLYPFLSSLSTWSPSKDGSLVLSFLMSAHNSLTKAQGIQTGLGYRESIRSWFCHLDVRHMPSSSPSSSSCHCCRLFFESQIIPIFNCSISPHGHCHTIVAHSRCHIIIRNTRATIPYYTCAICSNVNRKIHMSLLHGGTTTS